MLSQHIIRQRRNQALQLLTKSLLQRSSLSASASTATTMGPVSDAITSKLTEAFAPTHLEVRNESHMHNVWVFFVMCVVSMWCFIGWHNNNICHVIQRYLILFIYPTSSSISINDAQWTTYRPANSETHFKVIVISEKFSASRTPIARHRLVNETLKQEVASDGPVHALSIVAMTPDKWQAKLDRGEGGVGPSPNCRGGDGSLPTKNSV